MFKCHVFGIIMAFTLVGAHASSTRLVTAPCGTSITSQSNSNSNTTSCALLVTATMASFQHASPSSKGRGGGTQCPSGGNTTVGTLGGSFPGQSVTSTNEIPDPSTIKTFQGGNKLAPGRTKSNTLSELPILHAFPLTSQDAVETLSQYTDRKTSAKQRSEETAIQRPSIPITGAQIVPLLATSSTSSTPADTTATRPTSFLSVSPTPNLTPTSTSVSTAPPLWEKHLDARSIIGYVIGGALLLLLAVALYLYFRRRQGKPVGMSHENAMMETQNKQPYTSLIDRSSTSTLDIQVLRPTSRVPSIHRSSPGLTWIRDSRGSTSVAYSDTYCEKLDRYENLTTTDSSRIALLENAAAEIMRVPRGEVRSSNEISFTRASSSFFGEEDFPLKEIPSDS